VLNNKLPLYGSSPIAIPKAELYVVYTGSREDIPDTLYLSDLCGKGSVEVRVRVLRGGDSSIIGQYVDFCKIINQQRAIHGPTRETVRETIRICLEKGILVPFLTSRRMEVIDIMELLFSQEEVTKMTIWEAEARGEKRGEQRGEKRGEIRGEENILRIYDKLLKKLTPLGRVNDLYAAMPDKNKLFNLAKEFDIET